MNEVDSQKKENVTWTVPMDKAMLDTLREQTLLGNKGKGGNAGWKGPSFVAISNAVQPLCQQKISKASIQNRIKTMKKSKKGVEELLKLSGFGWSSSRNMVIAEDPEWDELIQISILALYSGQLMGRTSRSKGGTGVKNLEYMNKALLTKWLWRMDQERNQLWQRVISSKYGKSSDFWVRKCRNTTYGCGVWKGIIAHLKDYHNITKWVLGDGMKIQFWTDNWIGSSSLSISFPDVFRLAVRPRATVAEMFNTASDTWDIVIRRNLNDWEMQQYVHLLQILQDAKLSVEPDTRVWSSAEDEPLSVANCYNRLDIDGILLEPCISKSAWIKALPPRVGFFVWAILVRKLPTVDALKRRGFQIPNRCILCKDEEESADHLFLHCRVAASIWNYFAKLMATQWCHPESINKMITQWDGLSKRKHRREVWQLVPAAIVWSIWYDRNNKIFKEKNLNSVVDIEDVKGVIYSWVRRIDKFKNVSYIDVVVNWEAWMS